MAGVYPLFKLNGLLSLKEHRDCHAVVDGSNILYCLKKRNILCDFAEYGQQVRNFFLWLRNSNITPHVLLDGPSVGDSTKISRSRSRREARLKLLDEFSRHQIPRCDFSAPCLHNIFQDVVTELGIEILQVVGNRDFTVEIVAYAKHLDAIVISQNRKFFIQDIPRGCVTFDWDKKINPSLPVRVPTASYNDFAERLQLHKAKNPDTVPMWFTIMRSLENHCTYFEKFKSSEIFRNANTSNDVLLNVPRYKQFSHHSMKMLNFLRQHTPSEVEIMISATLSGQEREQAILLLRENRAAYNVPAEDVFERLNKGIDSVANFNYEFPSWFIHNLVMESRIMPGLMDVILTRQHLSVVSLEDLSRESSNLCSLRIRRVLYAILVGSLNIQDDEDDIFIKEFDRVYRELKDKPVALLRELWDPENPDVPVEVPGLTSVEDLSIDEKVKCFLLTMTVRESIKTKFAPKNLFFVAALKFWANCAPMVSRRDVINVLLTVLLIEQRTGSKSGIFVCPVSLHEDVDIRDFDMRHGGFSVGLEHMHPSAQLQSVLMFSRMLHRVLQEPLGDRADTVWEFFSERVYHDLCRYTKAAVECGDEVLLAEQIEALLERHFDGENKLAFMETVDFIWNTEDREYANLMLDHDSPDFEDFE